MGMGGNVPSGQHSPAAARASPGASGGGWGRGRGPSGSAGRPAGRSAPTPGGAGTRAGTRCCLPGAGPGPPLWALPTPRGLGRQRLDAAAAARSSSRGGVAIRRAGSHAAGFLLPPAPSAGPAPAQDRASRLARSGPFLVGFSLLMSLFLSLIAPGARTRPARLRGKLWGWASRVRGLAGSGTRGMPLVGFRVCPQGSRRPLPPQGARHWVCHTDLSYARSDSFFSHWARDCAFRVSRNYFRDTCW